jgi:hypothetical protein
MHIYETKSAGDWQKAAYEIWEYGPKPPSVEFSRSSGDLADAERAMAAAGYGYAVSVNLFSVELARGEAIAALPPGLTPADRQHALAEIDATVPERLRAFNRKGSTQYAEPRAFAELARAWPDLRLILAHLGGGSWRQTRELARAFPHLSFECCEIIEWTGAANAPTAEELARLIRDIGAHRVMLGTDFPWYDLDRTVERVMEPPLLAREEKEAILGANAARLLGLDGPPKPRAAR